MSRKQIQKPIPPAPESMKHHLKYKICVSGAAETGHCAANALDMSREIGKEIVRQNGVCVTGATTGIPYWAAIGAKEEGGISIGISPAANERDHMLHYKLPFDYFDLILYTGFEYSGRNLLLVRSSDAIISVCGRIGTLNEFTIAFEDNKPIGILEQSGGIADHIREILEFSHKGFGKVVFDSDPKRLVEKVVAMVDKEKMVTMEHKGKYVYQEKRG